MAITKSREPAPMPSPVESAISPSTVRSRRKSSVVCSSDRYVLEQRLGALASAFGMHSVASDQGTQPCNVPFATTS